MRQLELPLGKYADLQCPLVRPPISNPEIQALRQLVNMRKRMRAAHDKGRCWVRCRYHGKGWE